MTKQIFNLGKWYTIICFGSSALLNLFSFTSVGTFAFFILLPTIIWLFSLKLITEKQKEEIEIKVK
ncbi:hypothetical protein LCGC14_0641500 [marine sediment metagenome]|uniref:Uncharacterized protein n=1 Tax=marine sediment metagenome TaxID=412755 RepID=A0A0F9QZ17_9ZZZZ|nr:hypothetical protein [archaeon]